MKIKMKIKMKTYSCREAATTWAALLLLLIAISGCDRLLEEDPRSLITPTEFFQEPGDAQAAVDAIYTHLRGSGVYGQYYWLMGALASDEGMVNGFHPEMAELSAFTLTPHNPVVAQVWSELYAAIHTANFAITRLPEAPVSEAEATRLVAEARFMRALFYFDLVRMFGEVPLSREANTDGAQVSLLPRAPIDSLYKQIEADFTFATEVLPQKGAAGRPGALAAVAYLAKVALAQKAYNRAFQLNRFVIQSNQYALVADYADLFKVANNHSAEILFAVNFGPGDQAPLNTRTLPGTLTGASPWGLPTDALAAAFDPQDRRLQVSLLTAGQQRYVAKFWDATAEPAAGPTSNDLPLLRYADVLLTHAEAINGLRNGSNSEALAAINAVRKRARFDGTQELNILPNLGSMNFADFQAAILEERLRELAWEGHRWFDLVRMGKLEEKVLAAKPGSPVSAKHRMFPIPQREIDLNPNLTQNGGY